MPDADLVTTLRAACEMASADITAIYLFGSAARGEARPASDLDIAVLGPEPFHPPARASLDDLCDRLEAAGRANVDLIVLASAPSDLIHRILRDGVLLLDRDRRRRIAFEVHARNEYFDLEPIRRQYRRMPTSQA